MTLNIKKKTEEFKMYDLDEDDDDGFKEVIKKKK